MIDYVRPANGRAIRDAFGTMIGALGEFHLFGGLTFDQRRPGRPPALPPNGSGQVWQSPTRLRQLPRLTEDGSVRLGGQPVARDTAIAKVHWFLREGQRQLGRNIEAAVVALEYQRNGWAHFHPLLRLAGGLQDGDVATLGPIWFKVAGYARLEQPRSTRDVCEYAAKYLSKGLDQGDVIFWPEHGDLRAHQPSLSAGGRDALAPPVARRGR